MKPTMPTLEDLRKARSDFERIEPRDFFYWSVTKLVDSVRDDIAQLVPALMMLLTTWNRNYYRFFRQRKPGMTLAAHFDKVEEAIRKHRDSLSRLRCVKIYEITDIPESTIREIFRDFEEQLGRVGAAKCLHLLAPHFFPLWDATILKAYDLEKADYRNADNATRYLAFIRITISQVTNLGQLTGLANPLKSLDEHNYCTFTKAKTVEGGETLA